MGANDRQVHADLLDQVAASGLERADVRRVLGAPLTEQDLDALQKWRAAPLAAGRNTHAHRYSACRSGPCDQGRKRCPAPEACECADEPRPPKEPGDATRIIGLIIGSWALGLALLAAGAATAIVLGWQP